MAETEMVLVADLAEGDEVDWGQNEFDIIDCIGEPGSGCSSGARWVRFETHGSMEMPIAAMLPVRRNPKPAMKMWRIRGTVIQYQPYDHAFAAFNPDDAVLFAKQHVARMPGGPEFRIKTCELEE